MYFIFVFIHVLLSTVQGKPNINLTPQEPLFFFPGDDALIDCLIKDLENQTVTWKYANGVATLEEAKILTTNKIRITDDLRVSVLHRTGHDVWILKIQNVSPSDSGVYICEVNSDTSVQVSRFVTIGYTTSETTTLSSLKPLLNSSPNFTQCCEQLSVNDQCLPYCSVQSLLSGSINSNVIVTCANHMPSIISCLTDGRNHLPCCESQNVPDVCLPSCAGRYTLTQVLDNILCLQHAVPILSCIAEGIRTLPPQPNGVTAESISMDQIEVHWTAPKKVSLLENYLINITKVQTFDDVSRPKRVNIQSSLDVQQTFHVSPNETSYIIQNLKPFTLYEIVMIAVNKMGESLPTVSIRTLTHLPESSERKRKTEWTELDASAHKSPPDLRKCCKKNGLHNETCLDAICDPSKAYQKNHHLLSCLTYANISFNCMKLEDHEDCCQQRGISPYCQPLCTQPSNHDLRQNICFYYFPTFLNCYVEKYNVLSSSPVDLKLISVHHTWALLKWSSPIKKSGSVLKYVVNWKESKNLYEDYHQAEATSVSPFLLDNLKPGAKYEVYVIAVNKYGSSQDSIRVIFQTTAIPSSAEVEAKMTGSQIAYNETACCHRAGISGMCAPLCSYKVKTNEMINLGPLCIDSHTISTVVRCTVGGRDHRNCCIRRGVSSRCLELCAGHINGSSLHAAAQCAKESGNIFLCVKEGAETLPGMPFHLYAYRVTKDSIALRWKKSPEDEFKSVNFTIRYSLVNNSIPKYPFVYHSSLDTNQTHATLQNLASGSIYSIHVIANNEFGSSLPSLVLLIQTGKDNETSEEEIESTIGPPHAIEVVHQSYDTISLKWLSPMYLTSDARLIYRVYYRPVEEEEHWQVVQVNFNYVDLFNLIPNTKYAITLQAVSQIGLESHLSETLLVFTDSIEPADVDTPVLLPNEFIVEGDNVTIVCNGRGLPLPVISVFINGQVVYKKMAKKIFYTIPRFPRNVTSASCYAANGVNGGGSSSVQKSIEISVRAPPLIFIAQKFFKVNRFDEFTATCEISANPRPNVTWYKSDHYDKPVELSLNTEISMSQSSMNPNIYYSTLSKKHMTSEEGGKYICKAENDFGYALIGLEVHVNAENNLKNRIVSCCAVNGISKECLGACSEKGIDIDYALNNPHCLNNLDELIFCARDGYDHTDCCIQFGVHVNCLHYCDGTQSPKRREAFCLLSDAKLILNCISGLNSTLLLKRWNDNQNEFNLIVSQSNALKDARTQLSFPFLLSIIISLSLLLFLSLAWVYHKMLKRKMEGSDELYGFENQSYLRDNDLVDLGNRRMVNKVSASQMSTHKMSKNRVSSNFNHNQFK